MSIKRQIILTVDIDLDQAKDFQLDRSTFVHYELKEVFNELTSSYKSKIPNKKYAIGGKLETGTKYKLNINEVSGS